MESAVKFERSAAGRASRFPHLLAIAARSTMGIAYCLVAQQDEKNGFPLTAAMEWRKAAELLAPIALFSDRCWHRWERLMHLPRHLANPITERRSCTSVLACFETGGDSEPLLNTFSLADAA